MERKTEYQTYASFKSDLAKNMELPKHSYRNSLTAALTKDLDGNTHEGFEIIKLNPKELTDEKKLVAAFNKAMQAMIDKGATTEATAFREEGQAVKDFAEFSEFSELLDSILKKNKKVITSERKADVEKFLGMWNTRVGYAGQGLRVYFNTMLGRLGETMVMSQLANPKGKVAKRMSEKALKIALEELPSGGLRGGGSKYNFEGTMGNGSFSYEVQKGTRITDVSLSFYDKDKKTIGAKLQYNISVKTSASASGTSIIAWTTKVGTLMNQVFEDNYFGYGFYRLIGRLQLQYIPEVAKYILIKNFDEALLGSGADKISDFVINGKMYSAQFIIESISKKLFDSKSKMQGIYFTKADVDPIVFSAEGKTAKQRKLERASNQDVAISTWIDNKNHKYINQINSAEGRISFENILELK